ncbi:MAG: succinate dehydrogenase cytochrome b subunit [Thermoanaerobaculia bacterium]
MSTALTFVRSSIGRKILMAVSGVVLFGFVVGHLIGNLLVYRGPAALNAYAAGLRNLGPLLWLARLGLLAAVAVHIWAAVSLTRTSRKARPEGYRSPQYREATYASLTMRWGGLLIFLFIVYHLMHFTFGNMHPAFSEDVYRNVITGFQVVPVSLFYILAMVALGFHLYHGLWSMLQTVGLNHPRYNRARKTFAVLFSLFIVIGNISIPLAVLTGLVR